MEVCVRVSKPGGEFLIEYRPSLSKWTYTILLNFLISVGESAEPGGEFLIEYRASLSSELTLFSWMSWSVLVRGCWAWRRGVPHCIQSLSFKVSLRYSLECLDQCWLGNMASSLSHMSFPEQCNTVTGFSFQCTVLPEMYNDNIPVKKKTCNPAWLCKRLWTLNKLTRLHCCTFLNINMLLWQKREACPGVPLCVLTPIRRRFGPYLV